MQFRIFYILITAALLNFSAQLFPGHDSSSKFNIVDHIIRTQLLKPQPYASYARSQNYLASTEKIALAGNSSNTIDTAEPLLQNSSTQGISVIKILKSFAHACSNTICNHPKMAIAGLAFLGIIIFRQRLAGELTAWAAQKNHLGLMRAGIALGANVNKHSYGEYRYRTILELAVEHGDEKSMDILLRHSNTDTIGEALKKAASMGKKDIVHYLVEHGTDLNPKNDTPPLTLAVINNQIEIAEYLINKGANVNHKNEDGRTILWDILPSDNAETLHFLVMHGAQVTNELIEQAQHNARYLRRPNIVNYLDVYVRELRKRALAAERIHQEQLAAEKQQQREDQQKELKAILRQQGISECPICSIEIDNSEFTQLSCQHAYCTKCLTTMVDMAVREKSTTALRCPHPSCNQRSLCEQDIKLITDNNRAKIESYHNIKLLEWFRAQPGLRQCPSRDCPFMFINEENIALSAQCPKCRRAFCTNCLFFHDKYTTCTQARAYAEMASNNDLANKASEQWKESHTKKCPQCNASIERSAGCNHMICKYCKHEFCWLCFKQWVCYNEHGHHCPTFGDKL